jgi:hypothetical protein
MSGRRVVSLCFALFVAIAHCGSAQDLPWRFGRWNPDSFGNQRVVLRVTDAGSQHAVRALIPWRRRDAHPELKRLIVTDARGQRISNVATVQVRRDSGDVFFEPTAGAGDYYLYYLPYTGTVRSNYPKITYPRPDSTAVPAWLASARSGAATLPRATVTAFEAVDSLSQRWPMEVTATPSEVAAMRRRIPVGDPFAVFIEDRGRPVKMSDQLPLIWTMRTGSITTLGPALRDEYYAFQLGLWAQQALDSVTATFSPFAAGTGVNAASVPRKAFDCITTDGVDWLGRPFHPVVAMAAGTVRAIWCGVMIPRDLPAGAYQGTVAIRTSGGKTVSTPMQITVAGTLAVNHGDDEPWRLSRLRWLNSQFAADGPPTPPYTAVAGGPFDFQILGRRITLDSLGFPRQVRSYFTSDMTADAPVGRSMLAAPFALQVEDAAAHVTPWRPGHLAVTHASAARTTFHSSGTQGDLNLDVTGALDFDGNLEYWIGLVARHDTPVRDVRLVVPMVRGVARYFMGMNQKGGTTPDRYDWQWDVTHNQDAVWIGDVNAGLQLTLKDEHYVRPLNTNFYQQSPLVMPRSWSNGGKGGCRFAGDARNYRATCYSGPRTLTAGDTLWFNFRVLVTPFHKLDTRTHFDTRYYHAYKPVDTVRTIGSNLVNVHHATAINPFINYPFLRPAEMRAYADSLHAAGMRFKIYYTVRELTNHAPELWALRSLGTEVLSGGPAGGHSWLQEHVGDNYLGGWVVPQLRDVALVTSGISRWHNFYVEGMQWLTRHAGIDGIYLDDVAFDRATMLRIRRVLTAHGGPGERIDLHSANQYNKNDGFASSANLYLEHFPFIDRLWFGEYFDYDSPPDYWLVEMSGIPFGLMGEMLQGGGNPWRGMLFGMTNRLPWTGSDPRALWHTWDAFGIDSSQMRGWWMAKPPVTTGQRDVLATSYIRPGRAMIAIASWAKDTVAVALQVNWRALGLDSTHVRINAPEIIGFQPARTFTLGERIPVAPGRGWLLRFDTFDARPRAR